MSEDVPEVTQATSAPQTGWQAARAGRLPGEARRAAARALETYAEGRPEIKAVGYSHNAMIDIIIANPGIGQGVLGAHFGYTAAWVSTIMASDAFQVQLATRRQELVDPVILATVEERFRALATRSLEVLQEKLAGPSSGIDAELALKAAALGAKALGIGGNAPAKMVVVNSGERLTGLAERLTGLLNVKRNEGVIDVEATEREE